VGLINPPRIPPRPDDLDGIASRLRALDLRVRPAAHALDPEASDEQRAQDINELFADPAVRRCCRCAAGGAAQRPRHLPRPMGVSGWDAFTLRCARELLFEGRQALLCNPPPGRLSLPGIRTLWPGQARGPLAGGNLTVMSSMIGSAYFAPEEAILFVEEVQEPLSEVDRMLTQLEQAGVLERARGFVFGQCTGCIQPGLDPSLMLERVLDERIRPLGIPAWSGAAFGHIERQFVVPIGVAAEIDAGRGTIQLTEPAAV
jgi:muramoyltetrapeptide carboxypeptidase